MSSPRCRHESIAFICAIRMLGFLVFGLFLAATVGLSLAAEPADLASFPQPKSKKGLQVQMIDDALALGVEHAALNVDITRLIDPSGDSGGPRHERGERRYAFSKRAVEDLDARVKRLSDRGIVVYLILLPYASGDSARDSLLLHPKYARGKKNAGPIGMFNTTTSESTAWLAATVEFLAFRYSGSSGTRPGMGLHRGQRSQLSLVLGEHGSGDGGGSSRGLRTGRPNYSHGGAHGIGECPNVHLA